MHPRNSHSHQPLRILITLFRFHKANKRKIDLHIINHGANNDCVYQYSQIKCTHTYLRHYFPPNLKLKNSLVQIIISAVSIDNFIIIIIIFHIWWFFVLFTFTVVACRHLILFPTLFILGKIHCTRNDFFLLRKQSIKIHVEWKIICSNSQEIFILLKFAKN